MIAEQRLVKSLLSFAQQVSHSGSAPTPSLSLKSIKTTIHISFSSLVQPLVFLFPISTSLSPLVTASIIVLRYATITFLNTKISKEAALNGAYQQHSAFNVPSKTAEWVAVSTTLTNEDIVAFINSIPW
jgi:hypothetical protein